MKGLVHHKPLWMMMLVGGLLLLLWRVNQRPVPLYKPPPTVATPIIPVFQDQTLSAGLWAVHRQGSAHLTGLNETLGAGACAFDYNQDGWTDLFVLGGTGETHYHGQRQWWQSFQGNRLYHNLGNGRFRDVTHTAGFTTSGWGMGCTSGDLDNDGYPELLITQLGENQLYRNQGDGTFSNISEQAGLQGNDWSVSAALADYDRDGLLDLYIVNYLQYTPQSRTLERFSGFQTKPAAFDATRYAPAANQLYHNQGQLTFRLTDSATDASGRGLSALWTDINHDGWPDLWVTNDQDSADRLFINQAGQLNVSEAWTMAWVQSSRGVSQGDIDHDGDQDYAISRANGYPPRLLMQQGRQLVEHTPLSIADQSLAAGWGIGLRDLNQDGWLDLLTVTGLTTPDSDAPRIPQGQPNRLWLNQGDGWQIVPFQPQEALSARGVVFTDVDNDGDIDLYITHNNAMGQLLINQTPAQHWLGLQLQTNHGNRDALGAQVTITLPIGQQTRILASGPGPLSDSEHRLHFGLGSQTSITALHIRWPDGHQATYAPPAIDRYWLVIQSQTELQPLAQATAPSQPHLRLHLGQSQAHYRAQYVRWLRLDDAHELDAALRDADTRVRLAAINVLQQEIHPTALRLLIQALQDPLAKHRAMAIHAIQAHENEHSLRWLLHQFTDADTLVRCALADVFRHFFREEEAVIHRQYLAVPPLIRQLASPDPIQRQCAAHALGEAEHPRTLQPLLDQLQDSTINVRDAVIHSLGQLGERQAIPALQKRLHDVNETASTRAQAVIALARLQDHSLSKQLNQLTTSEIMAIVPQVLNQESGIVVNRAILIQAVRQHPVTPKTLPLWLRLVGIKQLPTWPDWQQHPDDAIRCPIWQQLLQTNQWLSWKDVQAGLNNPCPALIHLATHYPQAIAPLVALASDEAQPISLRKHALIALRQYPAKQLPALPTLPTALRIDALTYWHHRQQPWSQWPERLQRALYTDDLGLNQQAFTLLADHSESWAKQALQRILMDRRIPLTIRRQALKQVRQWRKDIATSLLLRMTPIRYAPLHVDAITQLRYYLDQPGVIAFLRERLQNPQASNDIRFAAAHSLINEQRAFVLAQLRASVKQ